MDSLADMFERKVKRLAVHKHRRLKKEKRFKWFHAVLILLLIGILTSGILIIVWYHQGYNWNYLSDSNGRKSYTDAKGNTALQGIDVSTFQGDIDWQSVKNDGIDFVMIRAAFRGYETGKLMPDDNFEKNISAANSVGLHTGVYVFSQALTSQEAEEEAELTLGMIQNYQVDFPVALDVEDILGNEARTSSLSSQDRTEIVLAFLKTIRDAGYTPMIYSSKEFAEGSLILRELRPYKFWLAMYEEQPDFQHSFQMWQYSKTGHVEGIEGNVDMDLSFLNF